MPGDESSSNQLLFQDSIDEIELGIYLHPGLTINNMTYRGYLDGQDIQNSICAALIPKPPTCKDPFSLTMEHINAEV